MCQRELVHRFAPMLMTVCRRYFNDRGIAEDAVQETFLRVFNHIGKYQPTGSFPGWLRRIAVTTSLQLIKKEKQRYDIIPSNGNLPDVTVSPEVIEDLKAEAIIGLIQQLPDGFRVVFNLYAIDGYTHAEIAEMLNISESASRSQLSRARARLVQLIHHQEKISI